MGEKNISIEGMMCMHCAGRVEKALLAVEGVSNVRVSLQERRARVSLDQEVPDEALKAAVVKAGYEATQIE